MKLPNLGIDIAKAKFNVCLLPLSSKLKHKVFPNTEAGFEQLSSWLLTQGAEHVHACLETTGNYGEARPSARAANTIRYLAVGPANENRQLVMIRP